MLPCTPQTILPLFHQMLYIRRSFYNSFLFTSGFLTAHNFVCSPFLHSLRSFKIMLDCTVLSFSTSSSPLIRPGLFCLKETPSEGSILEIQMHDFCVTFIQTLKECQEIWGACLPLQEPCSPFRRWPNLTAGGGGAVIFCRWLNFGLTQRCYHIYPSCTGVTEALSRGTSLAGTIPLPALLAVSHLIGLAAPHKGKAEDLPHLQIPPGSEVMREESRLKGL